LVGLGNPGIEYIYTRHNIGFLVVDKLGKEESISINNRRFESLVGRGIIGGEIVILVKPQTFMNLSGRAVKKIINFYSIDLNNLIVVHDDLDLPFGVLRIKKDGGDGGHKGLRSIIYSINNRDFIRLRIGVGRPVDKIDIDDYLLKPFNKNEMQSINEIISKGEDAIKIIISDGIEKAMNIFNKRI
jgi:PTH1 family peptidyl-tRNA hydrolase